MSSNGSWREEFSKQFEAHRNAFKAFARRQLGRIGNSDDADEVLQDAAERAIKAKNRPLPQHFTTWIYAIIRNLVRDRRRRRKIRELHGSRVDLETALTTGAVGYWSTASLDIRQALLRDELFMLSMLAIQYLPDEQREVIELRIQRVPFKVIAATQGVPVDTAKSRHQYALDHINRLVLGRARRLPDRSREPLPAVFRSDP